MALQVLINAVDRTAKVFLPGTAQELAYARSNGAIGALTFKVYGLAGAADYRPAIGDLIVVKDGGVTKFSGEISDVSDEDFNDIGGGTFCQCVAQDNNRIAGWVNYTASYTSVTLKAVLADLVANSGLSAFGVSLDAAQDNGPTINQLTFDAAQGDAILNQLQTMTGRPWEIDENLKLKQLAVGTASGIAVGDAPASNAVMGRVAFRQTRSQAYCNRVVLNIGQNQRVDKADTFTGDGVTSSWQLSYPAANIPQPNLYGYVTEGGSYALMGPTTSYLYDPLTGVLTRSSPLGAGVSLVVTYAVQFPVTLTADDAAEQAAHGVRAKKFTAADVFDIVQGNQLKAGLLNRAIATPKQFTLSHRVGHARIGQTVSATFAARNLSGAFLVIANGWQNDVDGALLYTQTVISGSTLTQDWVDSVSGSGSVSSSGSSESISGSILPSLTGAFPGDVVANSGAVDGLGYSAEVSLRSGDSSFAANSSTWGPAVQLGDSASEYSSAIVNNLFHVSGSLGRRCWSFVRNVIGAPRKTVLEITEDDARTANSWYLTAPPGTSLNLGTPPGSIAANNYWNNIWCNLITCAGQIFERGRTVAMGESTAYTPTWASGGGTPVTVGNATTTGRYTKVGKMVFFSISFSFGSTSAEGAGNVFTWSLPSTAVSTAFGSFTARILDTGTAWHLGAGYLATTSVIAVLNQGNTGGGIGAGTPMAWASGDSVVIEGWYLEA